MAPNFMLYDTQHRILGSNWMSASIMWKLEKPEGKSLGVVAPNSFIEAMRRAFGEFPLYLDITAIQKLEGMSAVWNNNPNPYITLIEILDKLGNDQRIKVWAEF